MIQNFDYQTPTRVIFGEGVVEKLADVMRPLGKADTLEILKNSL